MSEQWLKMCINIHVKYPLFLSDVNTTKIFLDRFSKSTQLSNLMEIHPFESELYRADGRTVWRAVMTKLTVAFRSFGNAPKPNHLTLYREIITVRSEIHTEHMNTMCGC